MDEPELVSSNEETRTVNLSCYRQPNTGIYDMILFLGCKEKQYQLQEGSQRIGLGRFPERMRQRAGRYVGRGAGRRE